MMANFEINRKFVVSLNNRAIAFGGNINPRRARESSGTFIEFITAPRNGGEFFD
jgi:hypothetical protein